MKKTIQDRLRELRSKVRGGKLSQGGGLGNEINYHIFDYDPCDEGAVIREVNNIADNLTEVVAIDIYECIIEILKQEKVLDKIFEIEAEYGTTKAIEAIAQIIDVDDKEGLFFKNILPKIDTAKTVFIIGIGESYQIVAAHVVLSNFQNYFDDKNVPVIMFYPGSYSGTSLSLFGKFEAKNYYRAFKLVER